MIRKSLFFPILLVLYEVVVYLSTDMYLPALPSIRADLNLDIQSTQTTLTMWFLGSGCFQWIMGPLSDYIGRRPILLYSIIVYICTCLTLGLTNNYYVFLIARFIQGGTIGPIFVGGYAAIHEKYPEKIAIKVLAILSCITIFAPTLGPVLGAYILKISHWSGIFHLLAILACIFGIGLFFKMPETLQQKQNLDIKSILKNYFSIIRSWKFLTPNIVNCLTFASMITWLTMGAFATFKLGFSEQKYGWIQAAVFSFYILGNRSIPLGLKIFSPPKLVYNGLIFGLTISIIISIIGYKFQGVYLDLLVISLLTFSAGICGPNLQRIAMDISEKPMGLKLAVYCTMISLSGAFVSYGVSWININMHNISYIMFSCLLLAAIFHKIWMKYV